MDLKVSDIIYLLDRKTHAIVPCKIIEKVSTVTLDGECVHHMVQPSSGKSLKLEDYKPPWFENLKMAREFLMESAINLIDASIEQAQKARDQAFGPEDDDQAFLNNSLAEVQNLNDGVKIDLGDGQTASVTLPRGMFDAENTSS